ncbi:MAG: CocE/NonD family hydrolase, partial [Lachnospiraceae bacterium]|nr:CocE/NonD family hydrolase [Lachnospiraceae bacterium]
MIDTVTIMRDKFIKGFEISGFPEIYDEFIKEEMWFTMRDGVRLKAIVYKPVGAEGPLPTILSRTCYPHLESHYEAQGEGFAKRGYAFVVQYCRGRGESEGEWIPNLNERADGIDTVNELYDKPWCDCIGLYGHSYTSMIGWAMLDAVEGKVASMFLEEYGTDRYTSVYEKGAFKHDVHTSWAMENGPVETDTSYERYLESCKFVPQEEVDVNLWGGRNDTYRQYISSPLASDELWNTGWWGLLKNIPGKSKIPVCIVSGWYDHHHASSMKSWERLAPAAKAHSKLIVGGWNHFFMTVTPGRKVDNASTEDIPKVLAWFDKTLVKKELPDMETEFYVIGADRWTDGKGEKKEKEFYLNAAPSDVSGACRLSDKPDTDASLSYIYDPADPVPTCGGEVMLKSVQHIGSQLQPKPGFRNDVLSF